MVHREMKSLDSRLAAAESRAAQWEVGCNGTPSPFPRRLIAPLRIQADAKRVPDLENRIAILERARRGGDSGRDDGGGETLDESYAAKGTPWRGLPGSRCPLLTRRCAEQSAS